MSHGTAEEVSASWLSGIQGATAKMTAGVNRVTTAPGQAAVQSKARWQAAMSDPATADKWARNVGNVTLQQWQSAMTQYGINRVAQGAAAKQQKFAAAMGPLLNYIDSGVAKIKAMPNTTFEDRLLRSQAMQRWMHAYQRPAGS